MVIPTFVRQALAGEPITVHGDGTQSRSFAYVGDVVEAVARLAAEPRAVGQVFNIGNTEEVTMLELARRVKQMTGSTSDIVLIPYAEAYAEGFEDMPRRVPNVEKLQALTGIRPTTSLDEILRQVVASVRATLEPANRG
jgi:UDP-glucose 4-epimerase